MLIEAVPPSVATWYMFLLVMVVIALGCAGTLASKIKNDREIGHSGWLRAKSGTMKDFWSLFPNFFFGKTDLGCKAADCARWSLSGFRVPESGESWSEDRLAVANGRRDLVKSATRGW